MIDIEALKIGDVVQLMSGSPFMTVQGFKPIGGTDRHGRQPGRTHVCVVVWSHRHGFLKEAFQPAELRYPREPWKPQADEGGEDGVSDATALRPLP